MTRRMSLTGFRLLGAEGGIRTPRALHRTAFESVAPALNRLSDPAEAPDAALQGVAQLLLDPCALLDGLPRP
jgi:hypothetical protein